LEAGPNILLDPTWVEVGYAGQSVRKNENGIFHISSGQGSDSSFSTNLKIKTNTSYRLKGEIKTLNLKGAKGALFNIHQLQNAETGATKPLKGQNDWTPVSLDFNSAGLSSITINALFGGWGMSTGQAWYRNVTLQELIPVATEATPAVATKPDAVRGENIFLKHQTAACNRCHQVGGEGGVIGPALDGIGSRKEKDYLLESLLEPGATIAEGYPGEVSPMPPMNLLLTDQEIQDVLAYLQTLR
jgi:mono/diheme cytochrome c family protein